MSAKTLPAAELAKASKGNDSGANLGFEAQMRGDKRSQHGAPPVGYRCFVRVRRVVHHLTLAVVAGFVLANCSTSCVGSKEAPAHGH